MNKFSKIIALCLSVIIVIGLFAGCGGPAFTSADAVDSSDSQQRWLKYPESSIVINPSATTGADTSNKLTQQLDLSVDGKTVENVLFTLEQASANGASGSIEWEADFSPETTKFTNMNNLEANNSKGSALSIVVPDQVNGQDLDSYNTFSIRGLKQQYTYDFTTKDYYLVIETGEMEDMVDINFYTSTTPVYNELLTSVKANETKVISINELCETVDAEALITSSTRAFFDIHFKKGGAYQFKTFTIKHIPSGNNAGTEASTVWAPYSMKNTVKFPNGTSVAAEDFFFDENTISRKITSVENGTFVVGGEIADGATVEYDAKESAIFVNGAGGVNYTVRLSKKDNVRFYATEEDMLKDNPLEDEKGAKFWTTAVTDLVKGDSCYFGISASTTDKAEDLVGNAKKGASQNRARKRLEDKLPAEWDELIGTLGGELKTYISKDIVKK